MAACSGANPLNDGTSESTTLPDSLDPASLATPTGQVQIISMADRNTCLRPQGGAQARLGDVVGTGTCSADGQDSWRMTAAGTLSFAKNLCLTAAEGGPTMQVCSNDPNQQISFALGRLLLGAAADSTMALVAGPSSATADFASAQLAAASNGLSDPTQQWQIGLTSPGPSGDANISVSGFAITLASVPGACLTGRGNSVGVTQCNGSASQAWIINETGAPQLGAYCLSATTPGSISQGTPSLFALCRGDDLGQQWRIAKGVLSLQTWQLTPTTMPPPLAGYTPTALTTTQVVWQLGG